MGSLVYVELLDNSRYREFLNRAFPWIAEMLIQDYYWAGAYIRDGQFIGQLELAAYIKDGQFIGAISPAALRERKDQTRAMISLRATNKNRDCMHGPTIKLGNHPFRSAARVVQCQLQEYLENRPLRGFAHVGVELGVPAESAGHRRPNASVANPRFQRNCCDSSCLDINCDGDGTL
jgi:hypothetical protein